MMYGYLVGTSPSLNSIALISRGGGVEDSRGGGLEDSMTIAALEYWGGGEAGAMIIIFSPLSKWSGRRMEKSLPPSITRRTTPGVASWGSVSIYLIGVSPSRNSKAVTSLGSMGELVIPGPSSTAYTGGALT